MYVILIVVVVFLVTFSIIALFSGASRYSLIRYHKKGRLAGFSFLQSNELKSIAVALGIQEPRSIFWDPDALGSVIKVVATNAQNKLDNHELEKYLDKLFLFQKQLENQKALRTPGLSGTKAIARGQKIRILYKDIGVFDSTIIENNDRFISCPVPTGPGLPSGFSWKGKHVSVYFWRNEDAGYVFDTIVMYEEPGKNILTLYLEHTKALLRIQKRKSKRVVSTIPAYLYLINSLQGAYEKAEHKPGMRCIVKDVSEGGFSLLIGGKAKTGMYVKAQFWTDEDRVIMSGIVKAVDYSAEENQSTIHVEAKKPSPGMSNRIRLFVYDFYSKKKETEKAVTNKKW